jgi:hypothetical protein
VMPQSTVTMSVTPSACRVRIGGLVEPVALLHARGDVARHAGAEAAQILRQNAGGRDAVHVVVAEDRDVLAPPRRPRARARRPGPCPEGPWDRRADAPPREIPPRSARTYSRGCRAQPR